MRVNKQKRWDAIYLCVVIALIIVIPLMFNNRTLKKVDEIETTQTATQPITIQPEIETLPPLFLEVESTEPVTVSYPSYSVLDGYRVCKWMNLVISEEEYELLCRTTFCEAGNQDLRTQVMVCLTILNRVNSWRFPGTITEVVYAEDAYSVTQWDNFEEYEWTEQVESAVNIALQVNHHPKDMFYFRTKHYHNFGEPYMQSDDLWFSTQKEQQ